MRDKFDEDALALIEASPRNHKRRGAAASPAPAPASISEPVPGVDTGAKRKRREVEDVEEPVLLGPAKRSRNARVESNGASPSPSVVLGTAPDEEMLMDTVVNKEESPVGANGKPNGRARKRNSGGGASAGAGARRGHGGRRVARKEKELSDEELLASIAVLQVPPTDENALSLALIDEPRLREIHAS
jgi:hypothetical protein